MKAAALILSAVCLTAQAAPEVVGVDLASAHLHSGMNNINPGFYARWHNGASAGIYYNSERRTTVWGGWTWQTPEERFAITLGVGTGYSRAKIVPMVVPSVRFGIAKDTSIRLSLALEPKNPAIHLSIERRF